MRSRSSLVVCLSGILLIGLLSVDRAEAADPDLVKFIVVCETAMTGNIDPIVSPGEENGSHLHTFGGNEGVVASSTPHQLYKESTTCADSFDRSSYWTPTLLDNDGEPVVPHTFRNYYRANDVDNTDVQPMPFGLRMVGANPNAGASQ